jgi:hypothetical protein
MIFVNHASINIYEEVRFSLQHPNKEEEKEKVCSLVYLETFNLIQESCFFIEMPLHLSSPTEKEVLLIA